MESFLRHEFQSPDFRAVGEEHYPLPLPILVVSYSASFNITATTQIEMEFELVSFCDIISKALQQRKPVSHYV